MSVREEIRRNLIAKIRAEEPVSPGIIGFEQTVIPQLENAILAGQDIILLGERGQAKTRLIRATGQPAGRIHPRHRRRRTQRRPL